MKKRLAELPPPQTPVNEVKRQKRATEASNDDADGDVREYLRRWESEAAVMANLRQVAAGQTSGSGTSETQYWCAQLRAFIVAYGVHRTFKGLQKNNTAPLAPIVRHIQRRWASGELHCRQSDPGFVVREVEALADICKAAGFARNLSFASKVLNMLGLQVPIFSSECLAFLRLPRAVSYAAFHNAWSAQYAVCREALESAATRHASALSPWPGAASNNLSKKRARAHLSREAVGEHNSELGASAAWLCVRALDVRMLREGGPMR